MNRLPPISMDDCDLESPALEFGPRSRPPLDHHIFAPLHYEPNYAYPLLIWLHGAGENERQLRHVMPQISLRNYIAYAPRGSATQLPGKGYGWPQTNLGIVLAEQAVEECIAAARSRFKVDSRRLFLAGFNAGGTMAFRVALANPSLFAGVLSIGGPFPRGGSPLGSIGAARKLPLFVAHGRESQNYSTQRACEELRLFHSAGMSLTLRQYPGGDDLSTQMLKDMDSWIMEQINGPVATVSADSDGGPKSRRMYGPSMN